MAKTVNYTPEMTARAVELYTSVSEGTEDERSAMVKTIAAELGKTERSVRSKLSREKVYIPKKVVSKVTGETPAKKAELAETLRVVSGANINVENVAKMNKVDITRLIKAFADRSREMEEMREEMRVMVEGENEEPAAE